MTRGHGKHTHRQRDLTPAQDAEYGIEPERDIPGGDTHLINRQVLKQDVPAPEKLASHRGMMAHGVPPHEFEDRKHPGKQKAPQVPHYADLPKTRPAIPVVIVEEAGGSKPLRSAAPQSYTLPAAGGDPVHVCGQDPTRREILLLNESQSSNIRFAQRLGDLANGGGALLPWPSNSYLKLETQDDLYAISADSGTPALSVIQVFELQGQG